MRIRVFRTYFTGRIKRGEKSSTKQADTMPDLLKEASLLQLGLSCDEVRSLDLRPPMVQEVLEFAGVRPGQRLSPSDTIRLLESARKVIRDHMQDIDRQLWMLQHRRDSLERKALVIERLIRILRPLPKPRAA